MPPPAKLSQVQSVWTSRCILLNVTNLGWWVYWVIGTNLYLIDQVELFQLAPSKVNVENAAKQTNNACAFDTQAMENKRC